MAQTSMSWRFGDTTLYRFVLDIPPDCLIPTGTVVDFVMRTPSGVRLFEESLPVQLPAGNLPYFEIFISPRRSFEIPPGNYIFSVSIKRPYAGIGNYRFTPLPTAPVTVTGIYSITPNNLIDLDGDTDPPAPIVIHLDCSQMKTILTSSVPPDDPVPPYQPPSISLAVDTADTPYIGDSVLATLQATLTAGSTLFQGSVSFNIEDAVINTQTAPPNGGLVSVVITDPISKTTIFTVTATDGITQVSANASVTFIPRPSSIYYGVSADTPATNVESGTSRLQDQLMGNDGIPFTLNGEGYPYIAFPASWGLPSTIKDHNLFTVTSGYSKTDIEINSIAYFLYTGQIGMFDGDSDGDYIILFK